MKRIYVTLSLVVSLAIIAQAQTVEELKAQKADLSAKAAELQSQADALNGQIADIDNQLTRLSTLKQREVGHRFCFPVCYLFI